jgi:hypothetical protein
MAMSFQDITFMLSISAYSRTEKTEGPFRILTPEENAEVDQLMQDLLGPETPEDESHDEQT